jgi:hypothetical protein
MKSKVDKEKVNTRDEFVTCIMGRATRTVVKRVEKYIAVDGGIFEHLL